MDAGDIKAVVFDIGSYSIRVGTAGEDGPQADIPTTVGVDPGIQYDKTNNYYVGSNAISVPTENMEASSPIKNGLIEDWDSFQAILDYAYRMIIKCKPSACPLLMSEAAWNTRDKREKLMELMFERYNLPAFFLSKSPTLTAFANGRTTALIVDSGSTYTTAIPVLNGYVVPQGIVKSSLAGDFITEQCKELFAERNIEIIPPYMVASKESVREEEPAIWQSTERVPPVTRSWHNYMCNGVISDFKASVLRVSSTLYNENVADTLPDAQYEFPNGYNCSFGTERLRITEGLFDPSTVKGLTDKAAHGVCETVMKSISLCDPGIRKALYSSVVLTGGNTLLEGYRDRLIRELPKKIPQDMKLKVFAKQNPVERRANAWFGGSTFAALGAFQQMCISKQEYDEEGSQCLERKCP